MALGRMSRFVFGLIILGAILILSLAVSLLMGTAGFNPTADTFRTIIFDIRLPRAVLSAIVGGLLAVSGVYMQTLFKNPLAEPYITGVSAGAGLGAVIAVSLLTYQAFLASIILPLSAFIGGMAVSLALIVFIRDVESSPLRLLLLGIALGTFCASILAFILVRYSDRTVRGALFWLFGSVTGASWWQVVLGFFALCIGVFFGILMHRHLDAMLLGSEEAISLGVNARALTRYLVFFATLLASIAVAFAGIVAFVGLMVPHVCRILFGATHLRLLITSVLLGMAFLGTVDIVARVALTPTEIPLSIITSLIGAPFFIFLLLRTREEGIG